MTTTTLISITNVLRKLHLENTALKLIYFWTIIMYYTYITLIILK